MTPVGALERDITQHLKNVHAAVLTVGGWFDAEDLVGTLKTYRSTERNNPGIFNALVIGPWSHGGWHGGDGETLGPVKFHAKTAEFFRDQIEMPFFRRFLKGDIRLSICRRRMSLKQAAASGGARPRGRRANAVSKTLYFHAGGRLDFAPPREGEGAFDEYSK